MISKKLDPRYWVNVERGMRVMIQEEKSKNSELIPCYVKEIMSSDVKNELGIKVKCEDGNIGRVKYIGTESTYKNSLELLIILEKKIRKLIVEILSKTGTDWWTNHIPTLVRESVEEKQKRGEKQKELLQIPNYQDIEETDFFYLHLIIGYKKTGVLFLNQFLKINLKL